MKRFGNLYKQIYAMENLRLAHKNARKGKGWYEEVKVVDADLENYLLKLQDMLINHTYKTSKYEVFTKKEGKKEREIYKLPYFPDRICQWAILQVIEPYLLRTMVKHTYSAMPGRGIHAALKDVQHAMRTDVPNCQFCLKIDVHKYYPSIDHNILKQKFRRIFKDEELLWLLDEIIDSVSTSKEVSGKVGIPIGNYLSQYCGNLYLSSFDHWLKEEQHVKYVFRYMDDIVIFGRTKTELHKLINAIVIYLRENLHLKLKDNWQVFPTYTRGIDFVGYRSFLNYTLLRKSTCQKFKKAMLNIRKKVEAGKLMNYKEWCSANSYYGWLAHCDCYRLKQKYLRPIDDDIERFYQTVIKKGD